MAALRLRLQKEMFDVTEEQLLALAHVTSTQVSKLILIILSLLLLPLSPQNFRLLTASFFCVVSHLNFCSDIHQNKCSIANHRISTLLRHLVIENGSISFHQEKLTVYAQICIISTILEH